MFRLSEKAVLFAPPQTIEPEAIQQIENTASMPFIFKHVAVMPDCHYGRGATVGTVLATQGAIIPAAVGVDSGCGMVAVRTPLGRGDLADPARIRQDIERRLPMSAGRNNKTVSESAPSSVAQLEALARKDYASTSSSPRELEVKRINCHHNFSQVETHFGEDVWVTRKGAIQAKRGMWAMIPGSMGTRSYIVTGLEHPLAFHSAPHGAGRRYSRTAARQLFTMKDLETAMNGIEFRHAHGLS